MYFVFVGIEVEVFEGFMGVFGVMEEEGVGIGGFFQSQLVKGNGLVVGSSDVGMGGGGEVESGNGGFGDG